MLALFAWITYHSKQFMLQGYLLVILPTSLLIPFCRLEKEDEGSCFWHVLQVKWFGCDVSTGTWVEAELIWDDLGYRVVLFLFGWVAALISVRSWSRSSFRLIGLLLVVLVVSVEKWFGFRNWIVEVMVMVGLEDVVLIVRRMDESRRGRKWRSMLFFWELNGCCLVYWLVWNVWVALWLWLTFRGDRGRECKNYASVKL